MLDKVMPRNEFTAGALHATKGKGAKPTWEGYGSSLGL